MQQQDKHITPIAVGLSPEMKAASFICGIKPYASFSEQVVIDEVTQQIGRVRDGDLDRPAAMLAGHAEALDALFYNLLSQAQQAKDFDAIVALTAAAGKAQEGCRSAVEGLATFKRLAADIE